jgi:L-Ala-D/L-Glu epimerase / N-acetyl-D-glutamate racemase
MTLRFSPYTLVLKNPFTVAVHTRTTTPVMLVEVEQGGIVGYGEASMPPYLGENQDTARSFLSKVRLPELADLSGLGEILKIIDTIAPGNNAAKAAIDIALHDWLGKKQGQALHQIWRLDDTHMPVTSFTIGIDTVDAIRQKVMDSEPYKILKVKLGKDNDREIIRTIRGITDKPIRVDVNQGWQNKEEALSTVEWLAERNVELVEQPLPKQKIDDCAWLRERSPIPIIADESVVRLADVRQAVGVYDGINIKLMKSTGMHEAHAMIRLARDLDLKVMLGCMTETSCGISAATQLSPLVDYADLDGAVLISNDPFTGAKIVDGKMVMPAGPGIGAVKV